MESRRPGHDSLASMHSASDLLPLSFLLIVQLIVYGAGVTTLYDVLNWITPSLIFVTLVWSCYRMAGANPLTIWTPLFWFKLACAVYYGVGPIVPLIADNDTARTMNSIYILDAAMLVKVNLVTLLGILLVLLSSRLFLSIFSRARSFPRFSADPEGRNAMRYAAYFLTIGGALRYGLILPYVLGVSIPVLPGVLLALGKVYYAGIYLLVRSLRTSRPSRMVLAIALVVFEVLVSISSFSKTDLVFVLVFTFLGIIEVRRGFWTRLAGVGVITFVYFSVQPLVLYGRDRVIAVHGSINGAGLTERWNIIRDFMTVDGLANDTGGGGGLARLSYSSANAFIIAQYDAGLNGNTLRNAAAVVVPRAIWPDKPIISSLGEDLYFAVVGRRGSALGAGHFSEAYWNFGWLGLCLLMIPLGFILTAYSLGSLSIMAKQEWLLLPVVLMGVQIGLRVDGFFVTDIFGPLGIAIAAWFVLNLVVQSSRHGHESQNRAIERRA